MITYQLFKKTECFLFNSVLVTFKLQKDYIRSDAMIFKWIQIVQLACIYKSTQCKYLDILVICDCFKDGSQYVKKYWLIKPFSITANIYVLLLKSHIYFNCLFFFWKIDPILNEISLIVGWTFGMFQRKQGLSHCNYNIE